MKQFLKPQKNYQLPRWRKWLEYTRRGLHQDIATNGILDPWYGPPFSQLEIDCIEGLEMLWKLESTHRIQILNANWRLARLLRKHSRGAVFYTFSISGAQNTVTTDAYAFLSQFGATEAWKILGSGRVARELIKEESQLWREREVVPQYSKGLDPGLLLEIRLMVAESPLEKEKRRAAFKISAKEAVFWGLGLIASIYIGRAFR